MRGNSPCRCGHVPCGCCEGVRPMTPRPRANRPGLAAINYRIGTHGPFMQSMLARLSLHRFEDAEPSADPAAQPAAESDPGRPGPLADLTTRERSDPAIALLDAWATVADVLTFYQERAANEGYLRTATEMRSVHELARLVGYRPRPGVAASTYLAYTIDPHTTGDVLIPQGARAQSMPGPGELPQSFETSEEFRARAAWNQLRPRRTQPHHYDRLTGGGKLYLAGVMTTLKPGDPLLLVQGEKHALVIIREVKVQAESRQVEIDVGPWPVPERPTSTTMPMMVAAPPPTPQFADRVAKLTRRPSQPLRDASQLARSLKTGLGRTNDSGLQLMGAVLPALRGSFGAALASIGPQESLPELEVHAFKVRTGVFGRQVPKRHKLVSLEKKETELKVIGEWPIVELDTNPVKVQIHAHTYHVPVLALHEAGSGKALRLESSQEAILPGSWIVVDSSTVPRWDREAGEFMVGPPVPSVTVTRAEGVNAKAACAEYGIQGETTVLTLKDRWLDYDGFKRGNRWEKVEEPRVGDYFDTRVPSLPTPSTSTKSVALERYQAVLDRDFRIIRETTVFAQSERLDLAEQPIDEDVWVVAGADGDATWLELDALYQDLQPGRFVVLSGERADLGDETVITAAEPLMIAEVVHDLRAVDQPIPLSQAPDHNGQRPQPLPGDRVHTFLRFDKPLSYRYRRHTVVIHGNVVKATHGETRGETLGGGDASKPLQTFQLKQSPLTYVAAPTAAGAQSTLQVFVDDVQWQETPSFVDRQPTDRVYVTREDEKGQASITFGNGREGARPSTALQNIKARYRQGIGESGNVRENQISQLATRPLGVKEVINPLSATGGAGPESLRQARRNAPVSVLALDRLVATRDYADFARSFAGIAKASASELSDGRRQVVHITIAGSNDIPIDPGSDLFINLQRALRELGDPFQPIQLAVRELLVVVLQAGIRIDPAHRWERVVTDVRARLLDVLGFDARELGQDLTSSEVIAAIQSVRGVAWVDLDILDAIQAMVPDSAAEDGRRPATPEETARKIEAVLAEASARGGRPKPRIHVPLAAPGEPGRLQPAALAVLLPGVPATLVLNQIT